MHGEFCENLNKNAPDASKDSSGGEFLIFHFGLFAEIEGVEDLSSISESDGENTAGVIILSISVAGSHFESNFLSCVCLKPAVLTCAGAIETDLDRAAGDVDVGVVLRFFNRYGCGEDVYLGGVILVCVKIIEEFGSLALDKGCGGVFVRAVIVNEYLTSVKVGVTEYGGAVLESDSSCTADNDFIAELNLCKLFVGHANCDNAGFVDEVEAFLVNERRTNDTLNGYNLANSGGDSITYGNGGDLFGCDGNVDIYSSRIGLAVVAAGYYNGSGTGRETVHNSLAVNGVDLDYAFIVGSVGKSSVLKSEKSRGNASYKLKLGVAGVERIKLGSAVILSGKLSSIVGVEGEVFVDNLDGKETVYAA